MVSDFAVAQCGQVMMETRIMELPLKACHQYSRGENLPLAKLSRFGVNVELLREELLDILLDEFLFVGSYAEVLL